MKLAYLLPLALVAAAFAETVDNDECEIINDELKECIKTIPGDEGACMTCLKKVAKSDEHDSLTPERVDLAVATCTGTAAPCHGCADLVGEVADCGKKQLEMMGDEF